MNDLNKKNKSISEEQFFLQGPNSRQSEFIFVLKVFFEFIKGFRVFHFQGPCVTVQHGLMKNILFIKLPEK